MGYHYTGDNSSGNIFTEDPAFGGEAATNIGGMEVTLDGKDLWDLPIKKIESGENGFVEFLLVNGEGTYQLKENGELAIVTIWGDVVVTRSEVNRNRKWDVKKAYRLQMELLASDKMKTVEV